MTAPVSNDAGGLASALLALGFPCEVESRAGLALLTMRADDAARLASSPDRATILTLAREHGFTHVAVEITPQPSAPRAAVLRD